MNETTKPMDEREFAALAEAFGGDLSRWPAPRRSAAREFAARSPEAAAVIAQARALDRLLSVTDRDAPAAPALADRIVAAARRTPRMVHVDSRASPTAASAAGPASDGARRDARSVRRGPGREVWPSAAVLAACMLIGVFVGGSRFADGALPAIEEYTGLSLTSPVQGLVLAVGEVEED